MYDIADYGAALDGVTDDTAAFAKACTAIVSRRGTVHISGLCYLNSALTIQPNIDLCFAGGSLIMGPDAEIAIRNKTVDLTWFGANGTTVSTTGSIEVGNNELVVSTSAFFTVGNGVCIAGANEGNNLFARIVSITDNVLELNKAATATVADTSVRPADCMALQDALRCHAGSGWLYAVYVPPGIYQLHQTVTVPIYTRVTGEGRNISRLRILDGPDDSGLLLSGGTGLDGIFIESRHRGCVGAVGVANDILIDDCWFVGNWNQYPLLTGTMPNSTISNTIFEHNLIGVEPGSSNFMSMSNVIFYDIPSPFIQNVSGGPGIALTNVRYERKA